MTLQSLHGRYDRLHAARRENAILAAESLAYNSPVIRVTLNNMEKPNKPLNTPDSFRTPEARKEAAKALREAAGGIPTKKIRLSDIRMLPICQPRVGIDSQHVQDLKDALENGEDLGAIIVFGPEHFLADGWHRVQANLALGYKEIEAVVHPGGEHEAKLHALSSNFAHGLKLTNADKNRIVRLALEDEEMKEWNDQKIADHCHVTQPFVHKIRQQFITVINSNGENEPETPKKRKGKDGKSYSSKKEGKKAPVTVHKEKEKPKHTEILDDSGNPVPERLRTVWLERYERKMDLQAHATELLHNWPSALLGEMSESVKESLREIHYALSHLVVHRECEGRGCDGCENGLTSQHRFGTEAA